MIFLARVWKWLKDNTWMLLMALGAGVGAWWVYRSSRNKIERLEEALEVQAVRRKIAVHEEQAASFERQADAREPEIEELRGDIAKSKRRVVEIERGENLEERSDDEIADMFSKVF